MTVYLHIDENTDLEKFTNKLEEESDKQGGSFNLSNFIERFNKGVNSDENI